MKVKNKLLLITTGCFLLSSCTNRPPLPKRSIVETKTVQADNGSSITILTQHAINGNVIEDTDNHLNIVAKSDSAMLVGLKVLQFAAMFAGGGNGQVDGFSKEQLKGKYVKSVKNKTMEYVEPELNRLLKNISLATDQNYQVTIMPYKFKLIYEGLSNDDYELRYSTDVTIGQSTYHCSSADLISTDKIKPINAWEKDNYDLTQVMAKKVITNCFDKINTEDSISKIIKSLSPPSK